jgi:hypothetical protein
MKGKFVSLLATQEYRRIKFLTSVILNVKAGGDE